MPQLASLPAVRITLTQSGKSSELCSVRMRESRIQFEELAPTASSVEHNSMDSKVVQRYRLHHSYLAGVARASTSLALGQTVQRFHVINLRITKLDNVTSVKLRRSVRDAWRSGATVVALDLTDLVYLDSLGISSIVTEYRRRPSNCRLVLCSLTDYVREVLQAAQLLRVLENYETVEAARAAGEQGAQ